MNILGLIVEYNPFHNGHLYHLQKSKEISGATHTVAIMSGNFLQRGEPALFDKYTRAKMAVQNGVDLVIELPTLFACQSAEIFSYGAINTFNSMNCINSICFGSEIGDVDVLYKISEILCNEPQEFKVDLKKYLDEGLLFPKARSKALFDYVKNNKILDIDEEQIYDMLNSSNNILGIEYIKSILKLNSSIKPYTIQRIQSQYNSTEIDSDICSASAIRHNLKDNSDISFMENVVPKFSFDNIQCSLKNNFGPVFDEDFFEFINMTVLRDIHNLTNYFEVNEGIENKIFDNIFKSNNLKELQLNVKSKRYTFTKIKRILNNILLHITKEDIKFAMNLDKIPYIRILAFNDCGREIIKATKLSSDIKIITKLANVYKDSDTSLKRLLDADIASSNIYNYIYYKNNKSDLKPNMDFYISPIYVK